MISKKHLEAYRQKALLSFDETYYKGTAEALAQYCKTCEKNILHLTQELFDFYLIKENK